jgi:acetyl esterase/lipase
MTALPTSRSRRPIARQFLQLLLCAGSLLAIAAEAAVKRTEDIIYGRKFGTALTMDVFQPDRTNGAGIILVVSGGFFSSKEMINQKFCAPLLDHGYTVFAVVHGSQPRFIIPEIMQDIHRAARFIRHHAGRWGVDPNKLGVTGGSAGGISL